MITAFFRTVALYLLLMVGLRLTGKRQLGQMEPTELVLMMLLSDLAAVPMQDFGIPLLHGAIPIITLLGLSTFISALCIRHIRFRDLVCGSPTIVIREGVIQQREMAKNRLTVDELLEELRLQGVLSPSQVKYAVLETGGQLSVMLRADQQPVTARQMALPVEDDVFLPVVIVSDGHLLQKNMDKLHLGEHWLQKQLKHHGLRDHRQVFLLTVDGTGKVELTKKEGKG
ncbi:MAG: DUF421 domain-containing protein [Oscillospiraceae bacterium]|nr:DUF421 domain-containing protein [Oscillospiraceae bacterium]